ncbi:unnamed protein product [Polarella glacialis]|uniref:Apple domain-containing protein n=1 Tax=Polarella glacialis TaxID=89957 RepID=A0A813HXN6_POLGL|nr:unnamed protein product [Polarella glacialis]
MMQWLIGLMVAEAMISSSAVTTEPTLVCTGGCGSDDSACSTLICLAGYEMECQYISCDEHASGKLCGGEGYVTSYSSFCGVGGYVELGCCICNASSPPGPTVAPNGTGRSCDGDNGFCVTALLCPPGYNLSQPHSLCAHHNCSVLGPNYVEETMGYQWSCNACDWDDSALQRTCRTCEPGPGSTGTSSSSTSSIMPSTSTTTTSSMDVQAYMCALEAIEIMGAGTGAVNGVYRKVPNGQNAEVGRTALTECELCATWQNGQWQVYVTKSHFWRISGTDSLSYYYDGVGYMMGPPESGDWDYKMEKKGTKPDPVVLPARMFVPITGHFVQLQAHGYTCLRNDLAPVFSPVDGGKDRACRGATSLDNSASYYKVFKGLTLRDCQSKCMDEALCKGIEHFSRGRCEIWTRPEGILSSYKLTGYTCLRNDLAPVFSPVDGGKDRACRGATSLDNSASYYKVFKGLTLRDCQSKCMDEAMCKGIEHFGRGRCEIWTRPEGILSSYKLTGFTCLRNDLAPVFSPMDGGKDRACRGATSLDNSASYYKLFKGLTLGDCRSKCMDEPLCKGIEHATEYWHAGRCEIWTLSHGIGSSAPVAGHTCMSYKARPWTPPLV